MKVLALILVAGVLVPRALAETCITQSQMKEADRNALAAAAAGLAAKVETNDQNGVRAQTIAEYRQDFNGMAGTISEVAPKLKSTSVEVEQIYILDASGLAKTASGGNSDAQFFCSLNQTVQEAEFSIPQLPPGKYGFAMVRMESGTAPWRLSMLLREEPVDSKPEWLLAGIYPKELTAGGHEGLWYWTQARTLESGKQPWNAWLYYQQAQQLLLPANFVSSTHLDKLQTELAAAVPSAVSGGLSTEAPLVVKGADGAEYRFTSLSVDDSLHADKVDVAAHIKVDSVADAAAARKRNVDAMAALLATHPELRSAFHGMWVFADAPGQAPYATELAMAEIK